MPIHIIKLIALFLLALSTTKNANAEGALEARLHVLGSAAIGSVSQVYFENTLTSFGTCMGIGALKEVADYTGISGGGAEMEDIYWNALGCALGVAGVKGVQMYKLEDAVMLQYKIEF